MPLDPDLLLFWAKKAAALLVLPPLGPLLLIMLGLLRRGRGRRLAWLGLASAWFFSAPATVGWMLDALERTPSPTMDQLSGAQAIVILAGGQRRHAPAFGGATVNALSLERLRYGARLARRTGLPVLVSGGRVRNDRRPEADLMAESMAADFGLAVRWRETESRDTAENARNSAALLSPAGIRRVVLVTHAAHMARAQARFEASGLSVVPAPTAWLGDPDGNIGARDLLPTPRAAFAGWYAAHEWLGRLAYALRDRLRG